MDIAKLCRKWGVLWDENDFAIAGIYLLAGNEIPLGTLLAVIMYVQLLTKPIKKLSSSMSSIEISFSCTKGYLRLLAIKMMNTQTNYLNDI